MFAQADLFIGVICALYIMAAMFYLISGSYKEAAYSLLAFAINVVVYFWR